MRLFLTALALAVAIFATSVRTANSEPACGPAAHVIPTVVAIAGEAAGGMDNVEQVVLKGDNAAAFIEVLGGSIEVELVAVLFMADKDVALIILANGGAACADLIPAALARAAILRVHRTSI